MKFHGCEMLGTAAKTLAQLTNFPRAGCSVMGITPGLDQ